MTPLDLVPSAPAQRADPLLSLPHGVDVALPGEQRCDDRAGRLRCVRRPHVDQPLAHVRIAGYYARECPTLAPTCGLDDDPRLVS